MSKMGSTLIKQPKPMWYCYSFILNEPSNPLFFLFYWISNFKERKKRGTYEIFVVKDNIFWIDLGYVWNNTFWSVFYTSKVKKKYFSQDHWNKLINCLYIWIKIKLDKLPYSFRNCNFVATHIINVLNYF